MNTYVPMRPAQTEKPSEMMKQIYLSTSGTVGQSTYNPPSDNRKFSSSRAGLLFVMILGLFIVSLSEGTAQTVRTWLPTNGGVWTTPTNWSPEGIPVTGDEVIINTQTAPIVSVPSITLLNLTINGNCTLRSSRRTITITGTFTVADGATLSLGLVTSAYTRLALAVGANGYIRGTGRVDINSNSTQGYFNVRGTLTIDADALVTGNQNFRLYSGGTLVIANPSGITQTGPEGAIQVTGTRTFQIRANYVYNGTEPQVTGNGLTVTTPANLTIDNSAGVTLVAPTVISAQLTMANGELNMDSYYLTAGALDRFRKYYSRVWESGSAGWQQ